ncbi:MAG: mechanosensitive ion channel family protein [Kiritimatiellia bacterium]
MNGTIHQFWVEHSADILHVGYRALFCILVVLACILVSKSIQRLIHRMAERIGRGRLDPTLVPILCTTATVVVSAIGGLFILDLFGVNTTSLIALVGAAGLAIGLALKDTLSNIAAGIILLALRPFRAEDFVAFGSTSGTVKSIRLFNTVIETADGLFISIPNSSVWANTITNYTRNGKRRLSVTVGISYSDPIDTGLSILQKIALSEPRFLKTPSFETMVLSLDMSAVTLQLRGWTSVDDYWQTLFDLNRRIKLEIEAEGLSIPYQQRTIHLVTDSSAPTGKAQ